MTNNGVKKVLIIIPSLRGGGAEKVVVNLVNNFCSEKYEITLMTIFDNGVNKKFLKSNINYKSFFKLYIRGAWRIFKILPAGISHSILIRDHYDVEIAYLEGIATKIISGASDKVKKIAWLHCELNGKENYFFELYKNKEQFYETYNKFNCIVGVSKEVIVSFQNYLPEKIEKRVISNIVDEEYIYMKSNEDDLGIIVDHKKINFVTVGRLVHQKGFLRLIKIFSNIYKKHNNIELYILGEGPQRSALENEINNNHLLKCVHLLGFKENPYKYMKQMDCYICSSYQEGFSTSVSEAFIVGLPVITTTCSGSEKLCSQGAGLRCENNDVVLQGTIEAFIENSELRNQLMSNVGRTKRMLIKEKGLKDFENLLEEVCKK